MIYTQKFDSLDSFVRFIQTAPKNDVFKDMRISETGTEAFCGTASMDEALELCRNGWDAGLTAIKAVKEGDFDRPAPRAMVRNYYVGCCPNVPRALQGLPDSMRQVYRTPQKQRVLTLVVDMGVPARVNKEEYQAFSGYIYQAVQAIEWQGTRVEIISGFADRLEKKRYAETLVICPEIALKKASETLDAGRLSFALVHMSMFRRLGVAWIERCPCPLMVGEKAGKYLPTGYGHIAVNDEKLKAQYIADIKKRHGASVCIFTSQLLNQINSGEQMVEYIKSELNGGTKK